MALSFGEGTEPFRMVEALDGRVIVTLRGTGEVAAADVIDPAVIWRTWVCPEPRGLDVDDATGEIVVACASGELVRLDAAGGLVSVAHLATDLRDVVVDGATVWVSRFRSAEILVLDPTVRVLAPPPRDDDVLGRMEPGVAWRMIPSVGGGVLVLHQRAAGTAASAVVETSGEALPSSGWSGSSSGAGGPSCSGGLVEVAVTRFGADGSATSSAPLAGVTSGVDLAVLLDGAVAVVDAAESPNGSPISSFRGLFPSADPDCALPFASARAPGARATGIAVIGSRVIAGGAQPFLVWTGTPASLAASSITVLADPEPGDPRLGHELFHTDTGAGVACTSCHPEAQDDGRVWNFVDVGPRRTLNVAVGIPDGAPYHWQGDHASIASLLDDVLVERMGGRPPSPDTVDGLVAWLGHLRTVQATPVGDAALVEAGRALFESADVECATCHFGPRFTNDRTVDVGTGVALQVPSLLGVGSRGPYLHDGCAATLGERFGPCGGGDLHGHTSQLDAGEIDALVAYLETL